MPVDDRFPPTETEQLLWRVESSVPEKGDLAAVVELVRRLELDLRREWWLNHGHSTTLLYGDDGEMACGACPADFLRQPLESLRELVLMRRMAAGAEAVRENDSSPDS